VNIAQQFLESDVKVIPLPNLTLQYGENNQTYHFGVTEPRGAETLEFNGSFPGSANELIQCVTDLAIVGLNLLEQPVCKLLNHPWSVAFMLEVNRIPQRVQGHAAVARATRASAHTESECVGEERTTLDDFDTVHSLVHTVSSAVGITILNVRHGGSNLELPIKTSSYLLAYSTRLLKTQNCCR
jgi:hypothetical protein